MTFDDKAIEEARLAYAAQGVRLPIWDIKIIVDAALASMKARGIDPCAQARSEERELCTEAIRKACSACNGTGHMGQDECEYCGRPMMAIRALDDEKWAGGRLGLAGH